METLNEVLKDILDNKILGNQQVLQNILDEKGIKVTQPTISRTLKKLSAIKRANEDGEVRAVVVTGAGRAFCAGADLEKGGDTFSGRTDDGSRATENENVGRDVTNVHPYEINKPVIAAINGPAVGVGMTYPMLCDIRIAAEDAKMGFVFTRRGMIPELASHLLVQRVAGF